MERKIGEIFEYNGEWYQCVECDSCGKCSLRTTECGSGTKSDLADEVFGECSKIRRSDSKHIIFRKLEKVGEPYTTFVDKTVQNYLLETAVSVPPKDVFTLINNEQRLIAIEIKQNKEDMEERELDPHMAKVIDEATQKMVEEIGRQIEANINKQRMKPFNLKAAKAGKPICTRDGRKARIICFDRNDLYPIVALIECEDGKEIIGAYSKEGQTEIYEIKGTNLMMLPEKKEGWVNVYREESNNNERLIEQTIYKTRKDAFDNACPKGYITTTKINWEE